MMKCCFMTCGAALVLLTGACEKKVPGKIPGETADAAKAPQAEIQPIATHLGFATRVPQDADLFLAGYGANEMAGGLVKTFIAPDDMKPEQLAEFQNVMSYLGDEMFLFVGPGVAGQFQMIGKSYRDLSAAWAGFAVGTMLDAVGKADASPDFSKLSEALSGDLIEKWMEALEKDSRLTVPSLVIGWKPNPDKANECLDTVAKWLEEQLSSKKDVLPVKFEASGVALAGFEISGREAFGEFVAEARAEMAKEGGNKELLEQISPDRLERLFASMENMRLTMATGITDGRILVYVGNGSEGFRLAASPAESLAASDDLTWTHGFAKKPMNCALYLSESMVRAALPLLDSSAYWDAISRAIRPPVREQRLFRELLNGLADTERLLAKRDASAWSAIVFEDKGWHLESRGGWPDPSLDYQTPLRMTDAAISQKPAIRAHWIQQRGRNDLSWKRLEHYGHLIDAVIGEFSAAENPMLAMLPEGSLARMTDEVAGINQAYRDEFRAGIGDEVAVIADFQGEVPPIPGISEETVKTAKAPRFIVARPVEDREKLAASGKSLVKSWRSLTQWASEQSGSDLPLILPQSIESAGLVTWYPPLPFIGGDFMPGVTLNDDLWMLGTSRSLAGGFSKSMSTPSNSGETGMIVEIDFTALREWLVDTYERNETEAMALAEEAPDEMKAITNQQNLDRAGSVMRRIQGLGYRKWMDAGKPRSSLHLRIDPAQ